MSDQGLSSLFDELAALQQFVRTGDDQLVNLLNGAHVAFYREPSPMGPLKVLSSIFNGNPVIVVKLPLVEGEVAHRVASRVDLESADSPEAVKVLRVFKAQAAAVGLK